MKKDPRKICKAIEKWDEMKFKEAIIESWGVRKAVKIREMASMSTMEE